MARAQTLEELQAEIEALKKELGIEQKARGAAEEMAQALAAASSFSGPNATEQPTGRTVPVSVCTNPTCNEKKNQIWTTVQVPTYYYLIDLPKGTAGSTGSFLMTNGIQYFHGQTAEVDEITLGELKSRVARCWDHEKSVHGENENAYRRHTTDYYLHHKLPVPN